ncbi:unnamed protein product [Absidia cylindrospora]
MNKKNLRDKENLKTLQRDDPAILNIIDQTIGVVVYSYSYEDSQWSEISGQGPFFLVKRDTRPFYTMILLNQNACENLTLGMTSYDTIEVEGRLIMYTSIRQGHRAIIGFRLYYQDEVERIVTNMKIMQRYTRYYDGIFNRLLTYQTNPKWAGYTHMKAQIRRAIQDLSDVLPPFDYKVVVDKYRFPNSNVVKNINIRIDVEISAVRFMKGLSLA